MQERVTELTKQGQKLPCPVYKELESFKQVKQVTDEVLMDVIETGTIHI